MTLIPILIPTPVSSGGGASSGPELPIEPLELLTPEGYRWEINVKQNYGAIGVHFQYTLWLWKSRDILGHFSVNAGRRSVTKRIQRKAERYVKRYIRSMEAVYGRDSSRD